ncbi:hypothetical protein [Aeromicrobium sp. CTD01-1L150]|uniref:hypothetical protein n=1 Tax=Aeromicrobium sp. CTD01-1L150 TaxID=3341830 RepID=UPI0035BEE3B3
MPRRVNLPGADELFRSTARPARDGEDQAPQEPSPSQPAPEGPRRGSGRVKHDEKMTVYVTSEELLAIEQARLRLRGSLGRNVDRGRLVRAALAIVLEDLEDRGTDSDVARRLSSS